MEEAKDNLIVVSALNDHDHPEPNFNELSLLILLAMLNPKGGVVESTRKDSPTLFDLQTQEIVKSFATTQEYLDIEGNLRRIDTKEIMKMASKLDAENKVWKRGYAGF